MTFCLNTTEGKSFTENISLQKTMKFTSLLTMEESGENFTFDMLSTANPANLIHNAQTIVEYVEIPLQSLYSYLAQRHDDIDNITLFALLFLAIFYSVTIPDLLIFQIKNLINANNIVYSCLKELLKNVVSNIAECLKLIEKDNNEQVLENETTSTSKTRTS